MNKTTFTAFVIAVIGILAFCLSGCGENTPSKNPVDLSGSWHQSSNDLPVNMTAEIAGDHIQILMSSDLANGILYWDGTFDTNNAKTSSFEVVSVADEAALSQNTTKSFHYKNGDLSYDFTMLGKDYTVHMSRGE